MEAEILAASFRENWNYYRELCWCKSPKRFKQREETEKIRQEWIKAQQKLKRQ